MLYPFYAYKQFYVKQFSLALVHSLNAKKWFKFYSSVDVALWGATTPGQKRSGSNGNERLYYIPQSSNIGEATLSDCLVS